LPRYFNIAGQKFGRLLALRYVGSTKSGQAKWECKCDCGNHCVVKATYLLKGNTKSCGCLQDETRRTNNFHDLTGQRFGRLLVIERAEDKIQTNGRHRTRWKCQCDCGNITYVLSEHLVTGDTQSCGCLHHDKITTHGLSNTRIYHIFNGMKQRCYNKKSKDYSRYGGSGVYIDNIWNPYTNEGIQNFYNWAISHNYQDGLTIDRINPYGPYSPSNCRWTTPKKQSNNRTNTNWIYDGEEWLTYYEFSNKYKQVKHFVYYKLRKGHSIDEIIYEAKTGISVKQGKDAHEYDQAGFIRLIKHYDQFIG
jgi:hypothetical protein